MISGPAASAPDPEPGYFDIRMACSVCHRFVKQAAVEPIDYHAAAGWNGEVIDGHRSHPDCGTAEVELVYRWIGGDR